MDVDCTPCLVKLSSRRLEGQKVQKKKKKNNECQGEEVGGVCLQMIRRQAGDMWNRGDGTVPVEAEIESRRAKLLPAAAGSSADRTETEGGFLPSRQCVSSTWLKKKLQEVRKQDLKWVCTFQDEIFQLDYKHLCSCEALRPKLWRFMTR